MKPYFTWLVGKRFYWPSFLPHLTVINLDYKSWDVTKMKVAVDVASPGGLPHIIMRRRRRSRLDGEEP
jgi:hypothetical protein